MQFTLFGHPYMSIVVTCVLAPPINQSTKQPPFFYIPVVPSFQILRRRFHSVHVCIRISNPHALAPTNLILFAAQHTNSEWKQTNAVLSDQKHLWSPVHWQQECDNSTHSNNITALNHKRREDHKHSSAEKNSYKFYKGWKPTGAKSCT